MELLAGNSPVMSGLKPTLLPIASAAPPTLLSLTLLIPLISLLSPKELKFFPATGPLHVLCLLPGTPSQLSPGWLLPTFQVLVQISPSKRDLPALSENLDTCALGIRPQPQSVTP